MVFLTAVSAMVSPQSSGHKYDLEIQKVLPMNDTDYVVFEGLKVKRYNKTCKFLKVKIFKEVY